MMEKHVEEYELTTGSSEHGIVVVRHFLNGGNWIVYYKHEADYLATYDGIGRSPEEAIDKFIRHRINGEPGFKNNLAVNGAVSF